MATTQLRASQLVTTFGPGAMVDLPDESVLVAGLDQWYYTPGQIPVVSEPRLVEKVKQALAMEAVELRLPPVSPDQQFGSGPSVTVWRFPQWFIVQQTLETPQGYLRRRLVNRQALSGGKYRGTDNKLSPVVPIRFVRACTKGHLNDIDWIAFAHGRAVTCVRELWIEERGTTGDLDQVWIVCDCGKARPMSQAARLDLKSLGNCDGSRPWLGPSNREPCGEPSRLLIRSASNAYFPQKLSVISIPDMHRPIDDVVRSLWGDFLSDVETLADLAKVRSKPTPKVILQGIEDDQVMASIGRVREGQDDATRPVKEVEFEALSEAKDELGSDQPGGDFYARSLPRDYWNQPWMATVERVVLVHRLREVTALLGFTRFEAAGTDIQGELSLDVKRAPLAIDATWIPAIENRGEGVFLMFSPQAIESWLDRPAVIRRGKELEAGFRLWQQLHKDSKMAFPGLPFIMLHSFAHLLLTSISLECGYPVSSLRERVYTTNQGYGVLIYTGSPDAEGTLGGLVLASRNIARHVQHALANGVLCSSDPVCAGHQPSIHDHQPLLGSACHGCLLISETSCEQRNEYLDRALVVPTVDSRGAEFFPDPHAP